MILTFADKQIGLRPPAALRIAVTMRHMEQMRQPDGLTIVVADDNRDAADTLAMLLQLDGHTVSVARDGQEALSLINSVRPRVVLLDIGMPGLSGYQVARQVRANMNLASTMLIALTGWGQPQDRRRAREAGFDHHLVKPAEPQVLRSLLETL